MRVCENQRCKENEHLLAESQSQFSIIDWMHVVIGLKWLLKIRRRRHHHHNNGLIIIF